MARMTPDEVRDKLYQHSPEQWVVLLEIAEHHLGAYGFDNLSDFVTAPVAKGGLSMPLPQAKELLYFNPCYKHKAEKMCTKLGIAALAKSVDAANKNGVKDSFDKNENIKAQNQGGTAAKYRIAKLKRDHPEIAKRLEAGEFKNVAEAERAAGTRELLRQKKMVTVYLDDAENCLREAVDDLLPSFVLCDLRNNSNELLKNMFDSLSNEQQDAFHSWTSLVINSTSYG